MTEHDLLWAIQNTDEAYFDEAAGRMQRSEEAHTMKKTVIRRIAAGTAIAAALALAVGGGIYLNRGNGLTTPPVSSQPAPIEEQSRENFLGGHGKLISGVNGNVMTDGENWYIGTSYSAKISDAEYIQVQEVKFREKYPEMKGHFIQDFLRSDRLYLYDYNKGMLYSVSDNGDCTELISMPELFDSPQYNTDDEMIELHNIAHLEGGSYYLDGFHTTHSTHGYFRCFYDAESKTCVKTETEGSEPSRIFSDGKGGVWLDEITEDVLQYRILHITKDNIEGAALDFTTAPASWLIYEGSIYYAEPKTHDYCRYNMETGEKTLLEQDIAPALDTELDTERIVLLEKDGAVCYAHGKILRVFTPDLSEPEKSEYILPVTKELPYGGLTVNDICGDTVFMGSMEKAGFILYNLKTGQTQYLYHDLSGGMCPPESQIQENS